MPAVLVHGVPEVPAVWDLLRAQLTRTDVVTLQLPGFGCPLPEGFGATKDEYVEWLIGEVTALRETGPIDLVGHDWGAGFVGRLVSLRPDLVRTWAIDAAGFGDVDFEWHEFAVAVQTPGLGEELLAAELLTSREEQIAQHVTEYDMPAEHADNALAILDRTLADAILALYRSGINVATEWAPSFADIPAPGLAIIPENEVHLSPVSARVGAARSGATVEVLPGVAHWWMLQDPETGARALEKFWASVD